MTQYTPFILSFNGLINKITGLCILHMLVLHVFDSYKTVSLMVCTCISVIWS